MAPAVRAGAGRLGIFAKDLIGQLPALRRYATGLTGRAAEADDLVQDCIERALRRQDGLQAREKMGAWLRSILHNVFIDDLRRRRARGTSVDVRDLEDDLVLSAPPEDRAGMQDVLRATMALSVEHRQILLLVGVEGLSYREVAEELGVPLGTVMSRLARARERLREKLEAPGADIVVLRPGRGRVS
jgi:RNA polymerase sigma-70 factor (ECF subfamily)